MATESKGEGMPIIRQDSDGKFVQTPEGITYIKGDTFRLIPCIPVGIAQANNMLNVFRRENPDLTRLCEETVVKRKRKIVGFSGKKESGKSTAATYLVENHGYKRRSFAYTLKRMLDVLWEALEIDIREYDKEEIIPELGFSQRQAMQTLGTEWGRKLNPDLWGMCERKFLARVPVANIVYDDARFDDEVSIIHELGGHVCVIRDDTEHTDNHASEKGITIIPEVYEMTNPKTPEFFDRIETLLHFLEEPND
jgi:hypothetical protein